MILLAATAAAVPATFPRKVRRGDGASLKLVTGDSGWRRKL